MTTAGDPGRRPAPRRSVSLYLVRHAIAAERGPDWPDDALRPLVHRGRARMREVVRGLASLGVTVDSIYTSPLVRAHQTAEILAAGIDAGVAVHVLKELAPGHAPALVIDALKPRARVSSIALVGHEPGMGELAAFLLGTREPPVFKKGGVCRLSVRWPIRPGTAELAWLATPKMLRSL